MTNVTRILQHKNNDHLWSIQPDSTVYDAIVLMDEKNVGVLAVLHEDALVGVISERDYTRKIVLKGRSSKETLVKDIMTRNVLYVKPEQSLDECLSLMTEHHIRHLPVLDDENQKMIGMLSMGDVVKIILDEQKSKIEHLEHYISWEESF